MSWSITFNDLDQYETPLITEQQAVYIGSQHPQYLDDMTHAFALAKALGFKSVVLTGFRTVNPYHPDDEVVDVSVRGMLKAADFNTEMKRIIASGPDSE